MMQIMNYQQLMMSNMVMTSPAPLLSIPVMAYD